MLNTGEACEGKAAVLVDVKELSGMGGVLGLGGFSRCTMVMGQI